MRAKYGLSSIEALMSCFPTYVYANVTYDFNAEMDMISP